MPTFRPDVSTRCSGLLRPDLRFSAEKVIDNDDNDDDDDDGGSGGGDDDDDDNDTDDDDDNDNDGHVWLVSARTIITEETHSMDAGSMAM